MSTSFTSSPQGLEVRDDRDRLVARQLAFEGGHGEPLGLVERVAPPILDESVQHRVGMLPGVAGPIVGRCRKLALCVRLLPTARPLAPVTVARRAGLPVDGTAGLDLCRNGGEGRSDAIALLAAIASRQAITTSATLHIDAVPLATMIGAAEQLALADRGVQNPRGRDDECRNRRTGCGQVAPMLSSVRADENRTRGCRVNRSGFARIVGDCADAAHETAGIAPTAEAVHRAADTLRRCREQPAGLHAPEHVRMDELQDPLARSPEIAALPMSGSSAIVAINALMLKRTKLTGISARTPGPIDG